MCAYVQTFPTRDRLQQHITDRGLDSDREKIVAEMDATIKTAENYLYNYPGGVPWTPEFEAEYEKMMKHAHPWIDKPAMDRIFSFSRWICWHDGLNSN
jgi:hypothetical protein